MERNMLEEQMLKYIKDNHLEGQLFDMEMNNYHGFHFLPIHGTVKGVGENSYLEFAEDCIVYVENNPAMNKLRSNFPPELDGKEVWGYIVFYGEEENSPSELICFDDNSESGESIMKDTLDLAFIRYVNLDNPRKFRFMAIQAKEIRDSENLS